MIRFQYSIHYPISVFLTFPVDDPDDRLQEASCSSPLKHPVDIEFNHWSRVRRGCYLLIGGVQAGSRQIVRDVLAVCKNRQNQTPERQQKTETAKPTQKCQDRHGCSPTLHYIT